MQVRSLDAELKRSYAAIARIVRAAHLAVEEMRQNDARIAMMASRIVHGAAVHSAASHGAAVHSAGSVRVVGLVWAFGM